MSATQAVNEQMIYNVKPPAIRARRMRYVGVPQSGTDFVPGATTRFEIPTQPATYLQAQNTVLKFKVTTAGGGCNLDGSAGAACFIQSIRVLHGSNLLEEIDQYNRLASILNDFQRSPAEQQTIGSITAGLPGGNTVAAGAQYAQANENRARNEGQLIPAVRADNMAAGTYTYTIPLISGVIGSLCSKFTPLTAMSAAPLRLEVTWASLENGIQTADAGFTGWTVQDCQIIGDIIQVDPEGEALIVNSVGGNFEVNTTMYRQASGIVTAGSGTSSVLLPFRFSSLKSVLVAHCEQGNSSVLTNMYTSRSRANLTSFQLRIGSSLYPQNAVQAGTVGELPAEVLMETLKCFHHQLSSIQVGIGCNKFNFNIERGRTAHGTYLAAMELESGGGGDSSKVEAGINTLTTGIWFQGQYAPVTAAGYELSSYAYYDCRLSCQSGTCRALF